ncbi:MAG: DUF1176 domain-containing protein [Pseudomonadota bacterium]
MRYVDDQQGRAGGVTALVARGPKPAALVPPARPVPRIDAIRMPKGQAKPLDAAALRALAAQGECDANPEFPKPGFYRLDARSTLVLVPCSAGSTTYSHLAFVMRDGKAAPAGFDYPPVAETGLPDEMRPKSPPEIVESDFGEGVLTHLVRPRYPGGCGVTQNWAWDGARFRMTILNRLGVCGKRAMWLTHYRAEPVWKTR